MEWNTMETNNKDGKHHADFRLETLKEQDEKLLKETIILSNPDKETTTTSGFTEEPFQATVQNEGVYKARKPPRPPPCKPKVEQTWGNEDPIYSNHYSPGVNDSVNLNLLRDKYAELVHGMTNLTEKIKAEVNCSSSNNNFQAKSTVQQNGQCNAPPPLVGAFPHSANRWEEQRKALRETQNGGGNENSFYPCYFSDPNNDPYYRTTPRETMNVEILQKQLKEVLKLIEITIKSSQNTLASPNVNKYAGYVPIPVPRENSQKMSKLEIKPQNFEEPMSRYTKRAPPPIPRQHLQTFSKLEIHGNMSEELEQEEGECSKEPVYGNARQSVCSDNEMLSNDDVYTSRKDDSYYSSIPTTGSSLTEDELENLGREATMLNMKVETVIKDNNGSLGPSLRRKYQSCNLEKETDFKYSSQELLLEDKQMQPETEHLKAMLNQAQAENDSLKMKLQQTKDELERRMVLSNIPDEAQVNTLFLSISKYFISTKISYYLIKSEPLNKCQ